MATQKRLQCLETLGLDPEASKDDIKKAYKALARELHPDKNESDDATKQFQEMLAAYTYLMKDRHDDSSDDEDDGDDAFSEDDDELVSIFQMFYDFFNRRGSHSPCDCTNCSGCDRPYFRRKRVIVINTPYGPVPFEMDEDESVPLFDGEFSYGGRPRPSTARKRGGKPGDRYNFSCEYGPNRGNQRYRTNRGNTGPEPSKKWERKQMRRAYNARGDDTGGGDTRPPHTRDRKQHHVPDDWEPVIGNAAASAVGSVKKEKKKPLFTVPEPAKKLTKKEKQAEHARRQKEMAEIAKELEAKKEREKERLKKQEEKQKEKAKTEEVQQSAATNKPNRADQIDEIEPYPETYTQTNSKKQQQTEANSEKSKAKRRREAKQQRKKARQKEKGENGTSTSTTQNKGSDSDWDSDGGGGGGAARKPSKEEEWQPAPSSRKPRGNGGVGPGAPPQLTGPVFIPGKQPEGTGASTVTGRGGYIRNPIPRFERSGSTSSDTRSTNSDSRDRFTQGYARPGYQQQINGARKPKPSRSGGYQPKHLNPHAPMVGQSVLLSGWDGAGSKTAGTGERQSAGQGGIANDFPTPPPPINVWRDRRDFVNTAMPKSEQQEQEMLEAALEMSRLEAEANRIATKLDEADQNREQKKHGGAHAPPDVRGSPGIRPRGPQGATITRPPPGTRSVPPMSNTRPMRPEGAPRHHGVPMPAFPAQGPPPRPGPVSPAHHSPRAGQVPPHQPPQQEPSLRQSRLLSQYQVQGTTTRRDPDHPPGETTDGRYYVEELTPEEVQGLGQREIEMIWPSDDAADKDRLNRDWNPFLSQSGEGHNTQDREAEEEESQADVFNDDSYCVPQAADDEAFLNAEPSLTSSPLINTAKPPRAYNDLPTSSERDVKPPRGGSQNKDTYGGFSMADNLLEGVAVGGSLMKEPSDWMGLGMTGANEKRRNQPGAKPRDPYLLQSSDLTNQDPAIMRVMSQGQSPGYNSTTTNSLDQFLAGYQQQQPNGLGQQQPSLHPHPVPQTEFVPRTEPSLDYGAAGFSHNARDLSDFNNGRRGKKPRCRPTVDVVTGGGNQAKEERTRDLSSSGTRSNRTAGLPAGLEDDVSSSGTSDQEYEDASDVWDTGSSVVSDRTPTELEARSPRGEAIQSPPVEEPWPEEEAARRAREAEERAWQARSGGAPSDPPYSSGYPTVGAPYPSGGPSPSDSGEDSSSGSGSRGGSSCSSSGGSDVESSSCPTGDNTETRVSVSDNGGYSDWDGQAGGGTPLLQEEVFSGFPPQMVDLDEGRGTPQRPAGFSSPEAGSNKGGVQVNAVKPTVQPAPTPPDVQQQPQQQQATPGGGNQGNPYNTTWGGNQPSTPDHVASSYPGMAQQQHPQKMTPADFGAFLNPYGNPLAAAAQFGGMPPWMMGMPGMGGNPFMGGMPMANMGAMFAQFLQQQQQKDGGMQQQQGNEKCSSVPNSDNKTQVPYQDGSQFLMGGMQMPFAPNMQMPNFLAPGMGVNPGGIPSGGMGMETPMMTPPFVPQGPMGGMPMPGGPGAANPMMPNSSPGSAAHTPSPPPTLPFMPPQAWMQPMMMNPGMMQNFGNPLFQQPDATSGGGGNQSRTATPGGSYQQQRTGTPSSSSGGSTDVNANSTKEKTKNTGGGTKNSDA